MGRISMVMFDLSGTTVQDDMGVRDCLYQAAVEFGLDTTPEEILLHMGTNKIHLYQFLISKERGKEIDIRDFEQFDPSPNGEAGRPPTVGYLARLAPEKGFHLLVEAFLKLRRQECF